jgi:hypothetical protein
MHFALTFLLRYNKAFLIHGNAKHDPEEKENKVSVNTGVFLRYKRRKRLENPAQKKRLQASVLVVQYVVQWVPERKRAKGIFEHDSRVCI